MREFQERRRFRKLLHSRYAIAALILLCILLLQAVWGVYGKYMRSREIAARTAFELAELKARESILTASIADLNTEQGREREIRDRFGAVMAGERLIVLVEDESADRSEPIIPKKNWWGRFIDLFTRD